MTSKGLMRTVSGGAERKSVLKRAVSAFIHDHWGSTQMVLSSGTYQCDRLDGFVVMNEEDELIGLITYIMKNESCEIISLDSVVENQGIGTALVKKVETTAIAAGCSLMKVVTTNDNLHALGFYQKRGYQLAELLKEAVAVARKVKPEIPLTAENNIPIRDELVLEKRI